MAIIITLSRGQETIIDEVDADLAERTWYAHLNTRNTSGSVFYARHNRPRPGQSPEALYLHKLILERILGRPLARHERTDHEDRDTLNNQRGNLRPLTNSANSANMVTKRRLHAELPMGVVHTISGKYGARVKHNGQRIWLGTFDTIAEAQAAYQRKHAELWLDASPYYTDASDAEGCTVLHTWQEHHGIMVPVVHSLSNVREGQDAPAAL